MFCATCGKEVWDDIKFCPYCASIIKSHDQSSSIGGRQVDAARQHSHRRRPIALIAPMVLGFAAVAFAVVCLYGCSFTEHEPVEVATETAGAPETDEVQTPSVYTTSSVTAGPTVVPALAFDLPKGWEVDDTNWHTNWDSDGPGVSSDAASTITSGSGYKMGDANELSITNSRTGISLTLRIFMLGGYGGGASGGQHLMGCYLADCDLGSAYKVGLCRTAIGDSTGTLGIWDESYVSDVSEYPDGAENLGGGIIGRGPFYTSEATGGMFEFTFQTEGVDLAAFDETSEEWAEVINILSSLHEAQGDEAVVAGKEDTDEAASTPAAAISTYTVESFSGEAHGGDGTSLGTVTAPAFVFDLPEGWTVVSDELQQFNGSTTGRLVEVSNESTGVSLALTVYLGSPWGGLVDDPNTYVSYASSSLGDNYAVGYATFNYSYGTRKGFLGLYELGSEGIPGIFRVNGSACSIVFQVDTDATSIDWSTFDINNAKWAETVQILSSFRLA